MSERSTKITTILAVAIAAVLAGVLIGQGFGGDDDDETTTVTEAQAAQSVAPGSQSGSATEGSPVTGTDDIDDGVPDDLDDSDLDDVNDANDSGVIDRDDQPISTALADRVGRAAVDAVGGGQVNDVDRSDDPGEAFEVEVIQNGTEIDVALDSDLKRVPNSSYSD